MKKIILFLLVSGGSVCFAGFKTDALNVTSSSITINGTSYSWQAGTGTAGQCLMTDGGSPAVLTWGNCSSAPQNPALLLQDGTFVLLEDNSHLLLQ